MNLSLDENIDKHISTLQNFSHKERSLWL